MPDRMRPDSRRICHGPDSRPRAASVEPVRYMLYRHNDIIKCPVNPHSTGDVVKAGLVPATGRVSRKTEALRSAGPAQQAGPALAERSEEHTSDLQSLMRISYYVF